MNVAKYIHKQLHLIIVLTLLLMLVSCDTGGKSVTLISGDNTSDVSYHESVGVFTPAGKYSDMTASAGVVEAADKADITIRVTLEFAPDACNVTAYPLDTRGEAISPDTPIELDKKTDDYIITFNAVDAADAPYCGYNVEYIIDDVIYNLYFVIDN